MHLQKCLQLMSNGSVDLLLILDTLDHLSVYVWNMTVCSDGKCVLF